MRERRHFFAVPLPRKRSARIAHITASAGEGAFTNGNRERTDIAWAIEYSFNICPSFLSSKSILTGLIRARCDERLFLRAAEESIAFQIADILDALRADTGLEAREVRADGGAAGDAFLMQLQADVSGASVLASCERELSPLGAGVLAGIAAVVYQEDVLQGEGRRFTPRENARVIASRARWKNCLKQL